MAPPRKFSYERLQRLIKDHPEWPYAQYADVLTADERRDNPGAPRIKPDSVRRVVSQYRDEWKEDGTSIPVRGVVFSDLLPPLGSVAANQRMATPLRYLREIAKERRGEAPVTANEAIVRKQALKWESALKTNLEIVDLTGNGIVTVRPARADELDDHGRLIDVAAWALPGWQSPSRVNLRGRGLHVTM